MSSKKLRTKRPKFYHVPNDRPTKIRHTAFTVNSGKISTHNSFVDVENHPSADNSANVLTAPDLLDPYESCPLDNFAPQEHPNQHQTHQVCFCCYLNFNLIQYK